MQKLIKSLLPLFFLSVFLPFSASAQDYPKVELSGGFAYARMLQTNHIGWDALGAYNLSSVLGIAVDVSRLSSSSTQDFSPDIYKIKGHMTAIMAGPRFTSRDPGKLEPYLHLMMGAARDYSEIKLFSSGTQVYESAGSSTGFAMMLGGGVNMKARGPLSYRVFQLDYMGVRSQGYWTKGVRLSFGIALRIGSAN
jgi:hypothetical protein